MTSDSPSSHAMPAERRPVEPEQPPLPLTPALRLIGGCIARTATLLGRHRLHLPKDHLGMRLTFADGSTATVYRETVARQEAVDPAVLVVEFRLRMLNGHAGQAYFRAVSMLNTPLFAGFAGFRSKLWLAADERDRYRGLYQWEGADAAVEYVRALWWPLALVSDPRSIHYRILGNVRRDDVLSLAVPLPEPNDQWWRVVSVDPAA